MATPQLHLRSGVTAGDAVLGTSLRAADASLNVTAAQRVFCQRPSYNNKPSKTVRGPKLRFMTSVQAYTSGLRASNLLLPLSGNQEWEKLVCETKKITGTRGGALNAQMNIFSRIARIFRSVVEGVVSSAEDPEKILEQTVLEMSTDLGKLRQSTAQVIGAKRLVEERYNKARAQSDEWYNRAKKALAAGDESLAKEALKRRKVFEDSAKALNAQLDQQTAVADRIVSSSRLLESKISEARSKKDVLKARAQSAKTSKSINDFVGGIDTSSALGAFQRMEEKVDKLEAEAEAVMQLSTDDLSVKFAQLEADDVDDELKTLKQELLGSGISTPMKELPPWQKDYESGSSNRSQSGR